MTTWISRLVLPIQLIFAGSKRAAVGFSNGAVGIPLIAEPTAVPSLGPVLYSIFVICRLPAPGIFCTTKDGFPGT